MSKIIFAAYTFASFITLTMKSGQVVRGYITEIDNDGWLTIQDGGYHYFHESEIKTAEVAE